MKLSDPSLGALQKIITGNEAQDGKPRAPYRSGPDLVGFFNEHGWSDQYADGFPSRWWFVEERLREVNGEATLAKIVEAALDPRLFVGTNFKIEEAVAYLNQFLAYDGYEVRQAGRRFKIFPLGPETVQVGSLFASDDQVRHEFIEEQLAKCDRRVAEEDFTGAITNARSLLEAVLVEIEARLDPAPPSYDGDLLKLFKRVQKHLNLDPARQDVSEAVRKILSGFVNVVSGLAPLRNKMSDAHALEYKPGRHHARLAVNASKTIADFLIESLAYQVERGTVQLIGAPKQANGS